MTRMKKQTRKNFLLAGVSLAAVAAFFKGTQPEKKNTVTFLTQDGKLVQIDASKLPEKKLAASKSDLQNWIKK